MKCLDDCHNYHLDLFMDDVKKASLRFYEMREDGTKFDGVTNEEVLRVLIHRLMTLNGKMASIEYTDAINWLKMTLNALEARTRDREARGVEGTHNA